MPVGGGKAKTAARQRDIRLVAIVNPHIDGPKLARTFMALAERETKTTKRAA